MARKPKTTKQEPKSSSFLEALKFIGLITKDIGIPSETHVRLQSNWATASNGVLALGCPIDQDLYCCPQNRLFTEALSKCGEHFSLTQLDESRLTVKSNKFKAIIPCLDPTLVNVIGPDDPIAAIDNRLKEAFEVVSTISIENGQQIYNSSVLLNGNSLIATDGKVIIEYWHGIDLPSGSPIPKNLLGPLTKISKNLTRFGFSNSSVTFWFEDRSWIKSQLYAEEWPDTSSILNRPSNAFAVPKDFYIGLDAIKGFTDSSVFFGPGIVRSHDSDAVGASYAVEGLPAGPVFNLKQLLMIKPYAETIDFLVPGPFSGNMLLWFGKNVRGAISGITK